MAKDVQLAIPPLLTESEWNVILDALNRRATASMTDYVGTDAWHLYRALTGNDPDERTVHCVY